MGEEAPAPRTSPRTVDAALRPVSVPTLLRNILVRAFQDVVVLYSLPGYDEIDPSFVVAGACLMFGFMFGDVGTACF